MYSEMHIWRYNIKNYYKKHTQNWGIHRFQIDGQDFTSSYRLTICIFDFEVFLPLLIIWLLFSLNFCLFPNFFNFKIFAVFLAYIPVNVLLLQFFRNNSFVCFYWLHWFTKSVKNNILHHWWKRFFKVTVLPIFLWTLKLKGEKGRIVDGQKT